MSDYGTARREFWERVFYVTEITTIVGGNPVTTEKCAEFSDAALLEWEKRWLVEERRQMRANGWIKGGIAVALIFAGTLIAWPGEYGRHSAGMVLVIAGLFAAVELMKASHTK